MIELGYIKVGKEKPMKTIETAVVEIGLKVASEDWKRFLKLKAEKSAIERELKKLEESFDFPKAEEVAEEKQLVIFNGNGDEVGKLSVYWYGGATIPPAWRRRIS